MAGACTDLPGSAVETLVLVVDLVGYEVKHGPARVAKALESEAVAKAIKEALDKQAREFLKQQKDGLSIDSREAARQLGTIVGKAVLDAGTKQVKGDIEKTSGYRKVERSLQDLECAFKKSVIGVWIDENKAQLIIVGAGLALGAAAAMYVAKSGDTPADWAAQLAKDKLKTVILGKVELGVDQLKFVPSERQVEARAYANTSKWKALPNTQFSVKVQTRDDKVVALGVAVETKVPIAPGWYLDPSASADPVADKYSLALGVKGVADGLSVEIVAQAMKEMEKFSVGGTGSVGYQTRVGPVPFNVSVGAGIMRVTEPGPVPGSQPVSKTDVRVHLGLSIPHNFF